MQNENSKIATLHQKETTKDLNTCIEEGLSNSEFQKPIVKIINNLKKETHFSI
jgi:hypothetical protein